MTKKYKIVPLPRAKSDKTKANSITLYIYNQYTGLTTPVSSDNYVYQDGDIIETDDSFYTGNSAPAFTVDVVDADNGDQVIAPDVIVYSPDQADNTSTYQDPDCQNYPEGTSDSEDPGYVEIDTSYFDSYEQYYDENDDPVYTGDDCGGSIGIRG